MIDTATLRVPAEGDLGSGFEITIRPGVIFPNWSVVTSATVRAAIEASFAASGLARRWANLGAAQDKMRRAILEHYALSGHAPSVAELAKSTGVAPNRVRDLLGDLMARDMVVLDSDDATITGAYPFTERDTGHRVHLGDRTLNAMCAIDALGTGAMYGSDVTIESACQFCGAPIHVETRDAGRTLKTFTPESAIVWLGVAYENGCAATSLCTVMAFFCSDEHLASWRSADNPDGQGFRLSFDEGLQAGKAIFMPLLASAAAERGSIRGVCDDQ